MNASTHREARSSEDAEAARAAATCRVDKDILQRRNLGDSEYREEFPTLFESRTQDHETCCYEGISEEDMAKRYIHTTAVANYGSQTHRQRSQLSARL